MRRDHPPYGGRQGVAERLDYRELLKGLAEIDEWLRAAGFGSYNRIRVHKRNLESLARATENGTVEQYGAGLTGEQRRQLLWSFVESQEFVGSVKTLQRRGCEIPATVLERALRGPADLYFEDESSSHGRNAMFEILVAAGVAQAGLTPQLGEPDVRFDFEGRRIFIQCKRVLTEAGIGKRVIEAGKQLKRDLSSSCDPRDCGIVVVSISRVVNVGNTVLVVPTELALRETLSRDIEAIMLRQRQSLRQVKDPKVAGALFHLATPAFVQAMGTYVAASQATIFPIPGKSDSALLQRLASLIRL
jgi:hypothetical protein